MKRIRPLMVLLVSLALACMGSTLAFADSESSARRAERGRCRWQHGINVARLGLRELDGERWPYLD